MTDRLASHSMFGFVGIRSGERAARPQDGESVTVEPPPMRDPGGVRHEVDVLKDALICFCSEFLLTLDGRSNGKHSERMFRLRDNLIHRGWSLDWHYRVLRERQFHLEDLLRDHRPEMAAEPRYYLTERLTLFFLLDDVIFNALSHLDYFASLVEFAITKGHSSEKKWNSHVKTSHDTKNPHSGLPVIEEIRRRHRAWINHLQDYRGRVIHYNSTVGGHAPHVDLWSDQPMPSLKVIVPGQLARSLPVSMAVARDEATPVHAAAAIVKSLLGDVIAILQVLYEQEQRPDTTADNR